MQWNWVLFGIREKQKGGIKQDKLINSDYLSLNLKATSLAEPAF